MYAQAAEARTKRTSKRPTSNAQRPTPNREAGTKSKRSTLNSERIDSFARARLKLVHFPAHSPLPIAALPSMSLSPKAPFDLSACPSMSLASLGLHSRAGVQRPSCGKRKAIQEATDATPRKRHNFRHPKDGLYAAKQRPGFQPRKRGTLEGHGIERDRIRRDRASRG